MVGGLPLCDYTLHCVASYLAPSEKLALASGMFLPLPFFQSDTFESVCKNLRRRMLDPNVWICDARHMLKEVHWLSLDVLRKVNIASMRKFNEASAYDRLDLLKSTTELIESYAGELLNVKCGLSWHTFVLHNAVARQLAETARMLQAMDDNVFSITVNFDVFDLVLRRYVEEMGVLHPKDGTQVEPLQVIASEPARAVWELVFGQALVVPYDTFQERILWRDWPEERHNSRLRKHLAMHVNFPRDNMMSVYRFHCLTAVFGPWENLLGNFRDIAMQPGFVGIVNMIKAEEMLEKNVAFMRRRTVVMRFSRRQPDFLAFTSIDPKTRRVEHRRNVDRFGKSIPIRSYLSLAFSGYELVRIGVDDTAADCETVFNFAAGSNAYTYSEYPRNQTRSQGSAPCALCTNEKSA
jgi:hypothetical protein